MGGNVEITNHYGSGGQAEARPSPLAGSGVGVSGLVPQKPEHFVARGQVDELEAGLGGERVAVVVTGMRGAGKTHLAAAYARRVLDRREGLVAWINAETPESLYTGLAAVADRLNVAALDGDTRESARLLRDYLGSSTDRHLLVLDNAENAELLRELIPVHGGSRVVITTTNQAITALTPLVVDAGTGYTPEQAHAFLREATGITDDPAGERALARELGYLPLALAAAVAAIRPPSGPRLTYPVYLQRLREQPLPKALRHREGQEYPWSVDRALLLAIEAAETPTGNPEQDQVVAWLLGLFAVLAASGVDRSLLVHPDPRLDEHVDDAIEHCVRRSLLTWSTTGQTLQAHRLTARVLLERVRAEGNTDALVQRALDVIEPRLFDRAEAWMRRVEGAHLVDQIEAIRATNLIDFTPAPRGRQAWLRRWRASPYPSHLQAQALNVFSWATLQLITAVDPPRAVTFGQHTLTFHESALGSDHPDALTSRSNLAYAYWLAGRPDEAIPLFERTLTERERILGPTHPDTLISRNNLAGAYEAAGRSNEVITLLERSLADSERVQGADHPDTLVIRTNLAHAYWSAGRTGEAIPLSEKTLTDSERVRGTDSPETLHSRNNLANIYRSVGRLDEAISLYERNLTDRERVLGHDHPDTLISRGNVAGAYQQVGRLDEAIPLHEQTLADRERILRPDHPDTQGSRLDLAQAYWAAKRPAEAIPLLERTLADREQISGPDHPDTLLSRNNLAQAYWAVGRLDEAIPLFEQALTGYERALGGQHPVTRAIRDNLAAARQQRPSR
ncbi:tetratricopeptide repeat protein [Nocardia beijingensis]